MFKIAIIGCGNMGLTYARSFLQFNLVTRENLLLVARDKHHARELRKLDLGAELVIHFVGRESAAMLGIEQRGLRWLRHRAFTLPVDGFEALKPAGMQWNPLAMLMQRLAGPMVRRFMAEASTERPPPPGHLPTPRPVMEPWPEYVVQSVSAA